MKKKVKKKSLYALLFLKIVTVILLISIFLQQEPEEFSNRLYLLAVSDIENEQSQGSLIPLDLTIKEGSGNIFVDLDAIKDIDTQISIINSHKVACNLFKLDCENYDFEYDFEGTSTFLKGPSASAAIAILTAKTINRISIDDEVTITGSLSSGGVIGNVGGIDAKVDLAQRNGFEKVLIPVFGQHSNNFSQNIEVVEVLDLIEAYNEFSGMNYNLPEKGFSTDNYKELMFTLSDSLCEKTIIYEEEVEQFSFEENSSEQRILQRAQESYNSSLQAQNSQNYYSRGSFCYNANLNYRTLIEIEKNLSQEEQIEQLEETKEILENKKNKILTENYRDNIKTNNDFYVYLLINDRINEANEIIENSFELLNNTNESQNISQDSLSQTYAYANERFYTVELWEQLFTHTGSSLSVSTRDTSIACDRIVREISIKNQFLNTYEVEAFNPLLDELQGYSQNSQDVYLCIYKGLEYSGRIDTVINSIGIEENETQEYTQRLYNLTYTRLSLNSNQDFPLIPFIYYEYAGDLLSQGDYASAQLYSNYALAYSDLNVFLENENSFNVQEVKDTLYDSNAFILSLLILLLVLQFF